MAEPVELAEMRLHLRLDDDAGDEDQLLEGMIVAARRSCEANIRRTVDDLGADELVVLGQAMKLLVGHWHQNRETVVVGTISGALPWATEALLDTLRSYAR